jgi:hypothetical protein
MKWSYSMLKDFEQCARRYNEVRVLKHYPREETDAQDYGTRLHKAAEDFIKDKEEVTPEFGFLVPVLESIAAMDGTKYCEHEMGVRIDLTPCKFDAPDVWGRGIADIIVISPDETKARCFDYKSGNDKYPDTDQLLLMSLMIFKHFPTVQSVSGGLLFVLKGTLAKHRVERDKAAELWWRWRERVTRLEAAHANGVWNPKKSGLCKRYCPVKTCEFCGD